MAVFNVECEYSKLQVNQVCFLNFLLIYVQYCVL